MPPIYQAMVTAGLQSGRLSDAMEGMTRAAQHIADLRRLLLMSMVYPLAVFLMAYGLFVGMLFYVLPTLIMFSEKESGWLLRALGTISGSAAVWGPAIPIVVVVLWLAWLFQTSRAMSMQPSSGAWNPRLPMIFSMVRDARYATFAELLGLMVDHGVPLDRGLVSAAAATGDTQLKNSANAVAGQVTRGGEPDVELTGQRFPTLVRWALGASSHGRLAECLRSAAAAYQQRVVRRADLLRIYLPALLTLFIGGTATLVYALSLFAPFTQMLHQIAAPHAGV
jgi:general secretion pathway protein F